MGLRDDLLAIRPNEREYETPGGTVLLRGITLGMKDQIQRAGVQGKPWRGIILAYGVLDPETRERLFTDDDIPALNDLPAGEMEGMVDVIAELSALTDAEVEELEGN